MFFDNLHMDYFVVMQGPDEIINYFTNVYNYQSMFLTISRDSFHQPCIYFMTPYNDPGPNPFPPLIHTCVYFNTKMQNFM